VTPATPALRLIIVDDDPLVLSSLRMYFNTPAAEGIEVVGEACDGNHALELLDREPADVIMADVHMPGMGGLDLLDEVLARPDPPQFVAMTSLDEDETMLRILRQGGRGYILKSSRPQYIIDTVLEAARGGTIVSPQPATRLVQRLADRPASVPEPESAPAPEDSADAAGAADTPVTPSPATSAATSAGASRPLPRLSESEQQVLSMICGGLSNSEICRATGRSGSAVKKQVSHLLAKFGASSRVQLAVYAVEAGFAPTPGAR
jgi:DNA-binding NarL/FixJ family response regulator